MSLLKSFALRIREFPDLEIVEHLEKNESIHELLNILDTTGQGLIHHSVRFLKAETLKLLIKLGANPNLRTVPDGLTVLHICAGLQWNRTVGFSEETWTELLNSVVSSLLDAGCDPLKKSAVGNVCVHIAARENNTSFLRIILNTSHFESLIDSTNGNGLSCLHIATKLEYLRMVQFLLEVYQNKSDEKYLENFLNFVDQHGFSPLLFAVLSGNVEIVELLINNKANVNQVNDINESALHVACQSSKCTSNLFEVLINNGASTNIVSHSGDTPLHYACENLSFKSNWLPILLNRPTSQDALRHSNKTGLTPILIAAKLGRLSFIKLLISSGACPYDMDNTHKSILHLCSANNQWKTLELLLDSYCLQALVNAPCVNGYTPLHITCMAGYEECVKILMKYGADPLAQNKWQQTPIKLALKHGYTNITEILLAGIVRTNNESEFFLPTLLKRLKAACRTGCIDYVKGQLKEFQPIGLDLTKGSKTAEICLDEAIRYSQPEVIEIIMDSELWQQSLRSCSGSEVSLSTPIRVLISKYPNIALRVFDKCIEKRIDTDELVFRYEFLEDSYAINLGRKFLGSEDNHFCYIDPFDENGKLLDSAVPYSTDPNVIKDNHPIMLMVKLQREELLNHPLIKTILYDKWYSYGRFWYSFLLLTYVNFMIFLCGYLIDTEAPYKYTNYTEDYDWYNHFSRLNCTDPQVMKGYNTQGRFARFAKYVIFIQAPISILKEIFELFQRKYKYFTFENLFENLLYPMAFIFVFDWTDCAAKTGIRSDFQYQIGSVAAFLCWINLGLFLRKFRHVGIQIIVLTKVVSTFKEYLSAFAIFILAFGFVFYGLLQNQPKFQSPGKALIKTASMVIDDFDLIDHMMSPNNSDSSAPMPPVYYDKLATFFFLLFLCLIVIIIMNMLVGLAVVDIKEVLEKAKLRKLAMRAELVIDIETKLQNWRFIRFLMVNRAWIRKELVVSLKNTNRDRIWSKIGEKLKFLKIFPFFRPKQNRVIMAAIEIADKNYTASMRDPAVGEDLNFLKAVEVLKRQQKDLTEQLRRHSMQIHNLINAKLGEKR